MPKDSPLDMEEIHLQEPSVILSKETLVPVGIAFAVLIPIVSVIFFFASLQGDVKELKGQLSSVAERESANTAKIELLNNKQTETDTKFTYISNTLDEIRKKLNILP